MPQAAFLRLPHSALEKARQARRSSTTTRNSLHSKSHCVLPPVHKDPEHWIPRLAANTLKKFDWGGGGCESGRRTAKTEPERPEEELTKQRRRQQHTLKLELVLPKSEQQFVKRW
jgi:hypothetical protein